MCACERAGWNLIEHSTSFRPWSGDCTAKRYYTWEEERNRRAKSTSFHFQAAWLCVQLLMSFFLNSLRNLRVVLSVCNSPVLCWSSPTTIEQLLTLYSVFVIFKTHSSRHSQVLAQLWKKMLNLFRQRRRMNEFHLHPFFFSRKCRELIPTIPRIHSPSHRDVNLIKNSGETFHFSSSSSQQRAHSTRSFFSRCSALFPLDDEKFYISLFLFMIASQSYDYFWCVSWKSSYCLLPT